MTTDRIPYNTLHARVKRKKTMADQDCAG